MEFEDIFENNEDHLAIAYKYTCRDLLDYWYEQLHKLVMVQYSN